jgi:hypothetical protein
MARITGADRHTKRLANLRGPRVLRGVTAALFAGAEDITIDAQLSITRGAVSGKNHVASAPGEPPNADTHVLANSGEATVVGPLKAESSFNAPYAAAQELGSETLGLPERPYHRPAAQRGRPKVQRRVLHAINKVVRFGV